MKSLLVGLKNVLLWSYARGTWQYDVLCGLIVLTLLFWPNAKARTVNALAKVPLAMADGIWQREIEWQTLRGFLQQQNRLELLNSPREAVVYYLQSETNTVITLSSIEPFGDAQGRVGYRARYRTN